MKPLAKILSTVVSLVAGLIGSKVLSSVWTQVTGDDAPSKKNKEAQADQSIGRIVTFAAISAGVAALTNVAAQRGAERMVRRVRSNPEEV